MCIRDRSYTDNGLRDFSDAPFSIADPAPIHVVSPSAGDEWVTDTIVSVEWISKPAEVGDYVRIGLHRGPSFWGWLALKTENDGAFNWIVPRSLVGAGNYKIRVQSYADNNMRDFGRKFRITRAPLVVTSPVRNDVWPVGSVQTITWQSNDPAVGDFVRIGLHDMGAFLGWLAFKTDNDGVFNWIVPMAMPAGTGYKIRVQSYDNNDLRDFSSRFVVAN